MSSFPIFCVIAFAYLLGSIPFGLLVTKFAGLGDIRKIGSGNIGATNVLRTGKKSLALLTVLLDGGKGALAIILARAFFDAHTNPDILFDQATVDWTYVAGFAAFMGHLYPVWLKFKGGKGVATAIGIITALMWPLGIGVMVVWLIVAIFTRYSSLAALISIGLAPLVALCLGLTHGAALGFIIFGFMVYKHKDNIKRLQSGTELKIGEVK